MASLAGSSDCFQIVFITFLLVLSLLATVNECKKKSENADEAWKKKDVTFYTDADLERLYEQWEEGDDEPLPEDELPEWKRPQPKIDLSKIDPNDPEGMLKMSKKGKTLMLFASVAGSPSEKETEQISMLWQSSLHNANIDVQRYVVGQNRVLFVVKDGALAWEVKNFLMTQDTCELVTIEGKDYRNENIKGKDDVQNQENNSAKKKSTSKRDKKKKKLTEEEKKIRKNIDNEILKNYEEGGGRKDEL